MHKIAEKEFTLEDFSCEHLFLESLASLSRTIRTLNEYRNLYIEGGSILISEDQYLSFKPKDKDIWWQMIQLLPSSYNQTRNVMLNYEVLANIYKSRKDHKLDEWREFCRWIESLPYSELIIQKEQRGKQQLINGIDPDTATDAAVDYAVQMAKDAARHYSFEKEE